ncbi:unnamed protein product [Protopolystoma xenopodis]|uniref:Alcohol dehydrogenase-like C-terminal domain-containing protein n=1 Tax=Protopolystoma xenopodis TaxID=117903 RepID=A0A3S5CUY7_9PLAT|nr:unnamed protein product [Protopolystoma xenopodis]
MPINIKPGDRIALATWPFLSHANGGCLADFVVCSANHAALIPSSVSDAKAAALSYSGLTAWSALEDAGGFEPLPHHLNQQPRAGPRVLIAGATGGVGLISLQLAKMWGAHVTVTVPDDARAKKLMEELGADQVHISSLIVIWLALFAFTPLPLHP